MADLPLGLRAHEPAGAGRRQRGPAADAAHLLRGPLAGAHRLHPRRDARGDDRDRHHRRLSRRDRRAVPAHATISSTTSACDKVHVAMYSPRPGTLSARWEDDMPARGKASAAPGASKSSRSASCTERNAAPPRRSPRGPGRPQPKGPLDGPHPRQHPRPLRRRAQPARQDGRCPHHANQSLVPPRRGRSARLDRTTKRRRTALAVANAMEGQP